MAKFTDQEVIEASKQPSAAQAAAALGVQYDTYRRHAQRLNVWKTNQSGKGIPRDKSAYAIPLHEILEGNHPQYQTHKLKIRMINEGLFDRVCNQCGLTEWLGQPISLELDHIDGNKYNHRHENLRLLCPNCHAQTDNYRGKNKAGVAQ